LAETGTRLNVRSTRRQDRLFFLYVLGVVLAMVLVWYLWVVPRFGE
jgi:hypothetical protein